MEAVLEPFALSSIEFRACAASCFDPARRAAVFAGEPESGEQRLGVLGQLSPALASQFKLRQEAYLAELDLEALFAAGLRPRRYQPLSRFPAVARDFSLVLDQAVTFGAVRQVIEKLILPELTAVAAVDRFRGGPVPAGKYSLLIRVTFQSAEQTLTEEQIRSHSERIVQALQTQFGATLRA